MKEYQSLKIRPEKGLFLTWGYMGKHDKKLITSYASR